MMTFKKKVITSVSAVILAAGVTGVGVSAAFAEFNRPATDDLSESATTSVDDEASAGKAASDSPKGEAESSAGGSSKTSDSKAASGPVDFTKSEVVYARLKGNGSVDDVYVVNILDAKNAGKVTDYGKYLGVQNLTDSGELTTDGDKITFDVDKGSFRYQGDLGAAPLPWDIQIGYKLDGKTIKVEDLGGSTGSLEFTITTKSDADGNSAFFDNYLMQISVTLPRESASDVEAPDGQIAMSGADTQVTFTAMPGKEGSFTVKADVEDFTMPGITFAAVPLAMAIESPDTTSLTDGFGQLGEGVGELSSGVDALASGAGALSSGLSDAASGASSLSSGASELSSGVASAASGAAGLLSGLLAYQQGLWDQAGAVADTGGGGDMASAMAAYSQAYSSAYAAAFGPAFASAYAAALTSPDAAEAAAQQAVASASETAAAAAASSGEVQAALEAVAQSAAGAGVGAAVSEALNGAAGSLGSTDNGDSLIGGAAALSYGMSSLEDGASSLASGASSLSSGVQSAAQGAAELSSGSRDLASGTSTLYEEVQKMPDSTQQEIDKMMAEYDKRDFVPPSFVSDKSDNVKLVQFVLSTQPVVAPEEEEAAEPEEEKSIWDRFLDLFR